MILSGLEIERQRQLGKIGIEPFDPSLINPNSCNLRLNDRLLIYKDEILDMKRPHEVEYITIPAGGLTLEPGRLYLGRTLEYTWTDGFVPMLEGRSSLGRLGLYIHVTAGFGDVGFRGYWTLEMHCIHPIRIYPFVQICQIYYHTIMGDYQPYVSGKYQGNTDIQPSMMYKELG
ncbi:MAG: dCTP deaminase [Oscillospiraceae bacterium]|nr:dCTP deaminase [Oscillospiraceae bacterium]